jgi:hypothetical protein
MRPGRIHLPPPPSPPSISSQTPSPIPYSTALFFYRYIVCRVCLRADWMCWWHKEASPACLPSSSGQSCPAKRPCVPWRPCATSPLIQTHGWYVGRGGGSVMAWGRGAQTGWPCPKGWWAVMCSSTTRHPEARCPLPPPLPPGRSSAWQRKAHRASDCTDRGGGGGTPDGGPLSKVRAACARLR